MYYITLQYIYIYIYIFYYIIYCIKLYYIASRFVAFIRYYDVSYYIVILLC